MSQTDVVHLISDIEVFDHFSNEELRILSQYFHRLPFKASESIVKEGDAGSAFYIVMHGTLKVFLPQEMTGRLEMRASDVKLNILQPGDCFGEYSMIDRSPASASISAITDGELIKVSRADFDQILDANDRIAKIFYRNVLHILLRRLRMREKEYDLLLLPS
jgi:CRP-like cAMP-binding protein